LRFLILEVAMIRIDDEFKSLIPPLTAEEYAGLEKSLLDDGCRDSLVLWGDTLIDGHNRYEICTKYHIPYETVQKDFDNRQSAIEWIILNQFGRRNLPAHERARLALRLKPVIAERAKEQQLSTLKQNAVPQNSVKRENPIDTQKELAKVAGVSHDTIAKVERIEEEAPQPIVEASRRGEISVNSAYQVTKLEPEEQHEIVERIRNIQREPEETQTPKAIVQEVLKRPHVSFNSGNNEWYTPKEFIEAARSAMGSIDLDPASNDIANEIVKAETYYTVETNGLDKEWTGNVWMNPPYASDLIGKFVDKLIEQRENYKQAIILVNNATETEWFNKLISISSAVCFPKSRVKFYMPDGKTGAPLQGQAVLYVGKNIEEFMNAFDGFGWRAKIYGVQRL
jgi:phage N-6-adenine-methyltransferase